MTWEEFTAFLVDNYEQVFEERFDVTKVHRHSLHTILSLSLACFMHQRILVENGCTSSLLTCVAGGVCECSTNAMPTITCGRMQIKRTKLCIFEVRDCICWRRLAPFASDPLSDCVCVRAMWTTRQR